MTVQQQPMAMATSPTDLDPTKQVIVIPALPDTTRSSTSTGSFDSASGTSVSRTVKSKPRTSAARRASHNAVERLRRENLNSRFLDLASLLPNLANIRRPTKSSIVNSCIAHVHASRRHRFLASQQLRALQEECESLRREANEWRDRAGVMLLPPPNRGEVFEIVLAGAEFELEDPPSGEGEGEEEEYGYGDEDGGAQGPRYTREDLARLEIYQHQQHQQQQVHQFSYAAHPEGGHAHPDAGQFQSPFAHNIPAAGPHSAGPDRWHDDHEQPHTWYDEPPVAPHSAHEPVMRGPYMHRVHTHPPHLEQRVHLPPHAQQDQQPLSPLFASPEYPYDPLAAHQLPHGHGHTQQIALNGRDAHAQKWEFVPHSLPD